MVIAPVLALVFRPFSAIIFTFFIVVVVFWRRFLIASRLISLAFLFLFIF
jgi:hypothetical protein